MVTDGGSEVSIRVCVEVLEESTAWEESVDGAEESIPE